MPQRLHLEGSDPHELLVRAREQFGPHVTVVRAERVRTGGVMGFFAKEKYELTLEVPDTSLAIDADGAGSGRDAGGSSIPAGSESAGRQIGAQPSEGQSSGVRPSGSGHADGQQFGDSEPTSAELAAEIADAQALREEMFSGSAPVGQVAEALESASASSSPSADAADGAPESASSVPTSAEEFRKALEEFTLPDRAASAGESTAATASAAMDPAATDSTPAATDDGLPSDEAPEVSAADVAGAIRAFTPAAFPAADPDAVVLPTVRAGEDRGERGDGSGEPSELLGSDEDAIVVPQLAPEDDSRPGASRTSRAGDVDSVPGYEIPQLAPDEVAGDVGVDGAGAGDESVVSDPTGGARVAESSSRVSPSSGGARRSARSRATEPSGARPAAAQDRARAAGTRVEVESSTEVASPATGAEGADDSAPDEAASVQSRAGEGVVLHRWGVQADLTGAVQDGPTVAELLALGVPPRLLGERLVLSDRVPLLEIVARLGAPTQRRLEPGELLVVVGSPERARAVATQVAAWMGLPEQSVVLAGECEAIRGHGRRVRTEQAARAVRQRASEAASSGAASVVALGVAPGRRGAVAAVPLLDAFGADAAWAAVDASEAYGSAAALEPLSAGAHLDGIAAMGVGRSQAPAALLDASLPVAWMDGLPASPVVWAALLAERLSTTH